MSMSLARKSSYVGLVVTSTLRAEYEDVTPSAPVGRRQCFWGICCIHFRGRRACRLFYFLLHFSAEVHFCCEEIGSKLKGVEVYSFRPEDRDITLLWNVCTCLTDYTESKLSRRKVFLSDCCESLGSRKVQSYKLTVFELQKKTWCLSFVICKHIDNVLICRLHHRVKNWYDRYHDPCTQNCLLSTPRRMNHILPPKMFVINALIAKLVPQCALS